MQKDKNEYFSKNRARKAESNSYAFLAGERKLTPFVVLKKKNYLKGKLLSRFIFECIELCREVWD
jgi:hypothetical protein